MDYWAKPKDGGERYPQNSDQGLEEDPDRLDQHCRLVIDGRVRLLEVGRDIPIDVTVDKETAHTEMYEHRSKKRSEQI